MQSELSSALQDLRLELRLMRRDMDSLVSQVNLQLDRSWRKWVAIASLFVLLLLAVFIGDRQVTSLRTALHETELQVATLRSQVQALQYQVTVLRERESP